MVVVSPVTIATKPDLFKYLLDPYAILAISISSEGNPKKIPKIFNNGACAIAISPSGNLYTVVTLVLYKREFVL